MLGKLSFATLSGGLIDLYGLVSVYLLFSVLASLTLPILAYMPDLDSKMGYVDSETEEDGGVVFKRDQDMPLSKMHKDEVVDFKENKDVDREKNVATDSKITKEADIDLTMEKSLEKDKDAWC